MQAFVEGARTFVCSSGGNAGIAAAYACQQLGAQLDVVVPESTSKHVRDIMVGFGATVTVHGRVWDDANQKALALMSEKGVCLGLVHDTVITVQQGPSTFLHLTIQISGRAMRPLWRS